MARRRQLQLEFPHPGLSDMDGGKRGFWRAHPLFWGGLLIATLLLGGATWRVRQAIPGFRQETTLLRGAMDQNHRTLQEELLRNQDARSRLGLALMRRDLRLRQLRKKQIHLAITLEDSLLTLRNGSATLRRAKLRIGPDSTVRAPDGRTWRFVRPIGERYVRSKRHMPVYEVPEWVYLGRGEPVPPVEDRRIRGGLGRYVLVLDDGTEVYSAPTTGPLKGQGPKPGSFLAGEADLEAIFNNARNETSVFIY